MEVNQNLAILRSTIICSWFVDPQIYDGVQALSGGLAVGFGEIDGAFVDFDARDDVVVAEDLDEKDVGGGFLIEGFLEEDKPGEEGECGGEGFGCGGDTKCEAREVNRFQKKLSICKQSIPNESRSGGSDRVHIRRLCPLAPPSAALASPQSPPPFSKFPPEFLDVLSNYLFAASEEMVACIGRQWEGGESPFWYWYDCSAVNR
ncbi:hypothetical protein U1Q18_013382 [Sarracenia purpurea var. burkii]